VLHDGIHIQLGVVLFQSMNLSNLEGRGEWGEGGAMALNTPPPAANTRFWARIFWL